MWNAFASNNSGSYSIVGWFPSPELADEVAAELLPIIHAHSAWINSSSGQRELTAELEPPSPLGRWAAEQGLQWRDESDEDWPEYSGDNCPSVIAIGSQVLIHEGYTVSMPAAFGEFFYRRGGRVPVELDHTHHPLVAVLTFSVPWNAPSREDLELQLLEMRESMASPDSSLRRHLADGTDLVVRDVSFGMYWFEVAAVFSDLVAGVAAARVLASDSNVRLQMKLSEAWTSKGDPLAELRARWATDSSA